MREVGPIKVRHRQFAEDVVEDRGGVLDRVVALHHPCRFELGEGEGVDEFLQRHTVLQAHGHGDGEVVHHRAEARTFLMHVDEDLAKRAVFVFAGAQVDLVAAHDRLLGIALAAFRHLLTVAADQFLDHHLLDHLLGQHMGLLDRRAGLQDLGGLVVILDQGGRERLAQLRAVAVERVGLDAQAPGQLVSLLAVLDGGIVGHVDRLGDRPRDKALRRRHHGDVAVDGEEALALLAAGIGAIEHVVMLFLQEGRVLQGHGPADMVIRRFDVLPGEAEMAQHVEGGVVQFRRRNAEDLGAELFPERPLVEDEADVEGRRQGRLDLLDLGIAEAVAAQRGVVDHRRIAKRAVANRVRGDLFDLAAGIAQLLQCRRHRAVDDLEVAATGQLLEFDQCEVGLDTRRVAVHHEADGPRGGDHAGLRVAVTMLLAQGQRLVPGLNRKVHQALIGAVGVVERHRLDRQILVTVRLAMGCATVVADHAQHMLAVLLVFGEGAQFRGDLGRGGIGHAGHDGGQCATDRPALVAVIAQAHVHQQAADIGVSQTERAEIVAQLRDFLRGELRHHHRDFQRQRPQPGGVHIGLGIELAVLEEGQQVHRGEVAGRVVKEHVFRARVRAADLPVFGAGVPGIDRVVELDAGIGAGPGRVTDLVPQLARLDGLADLAVGAVDQLPVGVLLDRVEERVGHADRVVRILARDGVIGFRIPVGIVGRELDRGVTLLRVVQHPLDVSFRNGTFFRAADRGFQGVVLGGINRVLQLAIPGGDGGEDAIELALVHLGAGDDGGDLLLFEHLPVDEFLDIRVIGIDDHHLGRAARGAARLDRARRAVADLEEAHQARGLAATRQLFTLGAKRREVGAGAGAVFEQARFADPQVHDAAFVHQVVGHGLDEAGMWLRMFVGGVRLHQLAGLVVDIVVALARAVDAIGPVKAGVEPLRAVGRRHLARQHQLHFIEIGACVGFFGEVATFPAPIGPGPRETTEHLLGRGFTAEAVFFGQIGQRNLVGHVTPQERRNALFLHRLQDRGDPGLAEIFLRQHVRSHLAPAHGNFHIVEFENGGAVGVANFRRRQRELQPRIGILLSLGETAFDFHLPLVPSLDDASTAPGQPVLFPVLKADAFRPVPPREPVEPVFQGSYKWDGHLPRFFRSITIFSVAPTGSYKLTYPSIGRQRKSFTLSLQKRVACGVWCGSR